MPCLNNSLFDLFTLNKPSFMKFLILLSFMIPLVMLSQNGIVRGSAVNSANNAPIAGVKIFIVEASIGAISDSSGVFEFRK